MRELDVLTRYQDKVNWLRGNFSGAHHESYPSLIMATGKGLSYGVCNQMNAFELDARNAGYGDFDVIIKGSSRALIEYLEEEDALYNISYKVTVPGIYYIEIKFDMRHIPGSPFTTKVEQQQQDVSNTCQQQQQQQHVQPAPQMMLKQNTSKNHIQDPKHVPMPVFKPQSTANSNIKNNDPSSLQIVPLEATVQSPSGRTLPGSVFKAGQGQVSVKFPKPEIGTYVVTLTHKMSGIKVKGSPYTVVICPKKQPKEVKASGYGLSEFSLREENQFQLSGFINVVDLLILIIGDHAVDVNVKQKVSDSVDVIYDIKYGGKYAIHIIHSGLPITGSPFEIIECQNKSRNEREAGKPSQHLTRRVTFWCGRDLRSEKMMTELVALSAHTQNTTHILHTTHHRNRHVLDISFLPLRNDKYKLTFSSVNGNIVRTSVVIPVEFLQEDKELFTISGNGALGGIVNKPSDVFIQSPFLNSNSFSISFDGPEKVDVLECLTKDDRLCIEYVPRKSGTYEMTLKYDGFDIPQTPLLIKIRDKDHRQNPTEKPNPIIRLTTSEAWLCRAYGEGLRRGVAGEWSSFHVNAHATGSGTLMAGFESEKSSSTELLIRHLGQKLYNVEYKVRDEGTYILSVVWESEHITGSPFCIHISETKKN